MAQLTDVVKIGRRLPLGDLAVQVVKVQEDTGLGAATEWIAKSDIGFSSIVGVLGFSIHGTASTTVNFKLNVGTGTTGTSGTAGANPGSLAVETAAAVAGENGTGGTGDGLYIAILGKV